MNSVASITSDLKVRLAAYSSFANVSREQLSVIWRATRMWIASRLALLVASIAGTVFFENGFDGSQWRASVPVHSLLADWGRWDTGWYIGIADNGYVNPNQTAFFPLFPLLTRLVGNILGGQHLLVAGLVVANISSLVAFIAIGMLAANELDQESSTVAVKQLAAYPLAFFLAAAYTEGLFLALATLCLLACRRGHWFTAAGCALLAGLTRPTSLVLVPALAWEFVRQHQTTLRQWRSQPATEFARKLLPAALAVVAAPLGLILYFGFLWHVFGDPTIFLRVERSGWGHETMPPWVTLLRSAHSIFRAARFSFAQVRILIDLVPVIAAGILALLTVRRIPLAFTFYLAGTFLLSVASPIPGNFDLLVSSGRYLLACAPALIFLAPWVKRHPSVDMFLMAGGFMLQGILIVFFLLGGWII